MSKEQYLKDLTGQTFGLLTVIEKAGRNEEGKLSWRCKCLCGQNDNVIVPTNKLIARLVKSCGCISYRQRADLIGLKFGKLTVISFAGINDKNQATWLCECECGSGKEVIATTGTLRNGDRTSCGCFKRTGRECVDEYDIVGKTFGQLKVIERIEGTANFNCKCTCGRDVENVKGWLLINKKRKSCGNHTYRKDLKGQRFGKLVVLEYLYTKPGHSATWLCQCDCTNTHEVEAGQLLSNQCKSCGCLQKERLCTGYGYISGTYYGGIKNRAKTDEIEFDPNLTIEFLNDLLIKQNFRCAISGVEIVSVYEYSQIHLQTASLDRIDSKKGYTVDNVQWVHKDVNFLKQESSDQELIDWCHIISDHQRSKNKEKGVLYCEKEPFNLDQDGPLEWTSILAKP